MTPSEINVEIAKAVQPEFEWFINAAGHSVGWIVGKRSSTLRDCTSFYNSLDAMHEAEKVLKPKQCQTYRHELSRLIVKADKDEYCKTDEGSIETYTFYATSQQRAEAFLRTIGKWKE